MCLKIQQKFVSVRRRTTELLKHACAVSTLFRWGYSFRSLREGGLPASEFRCAVNDSSVPNLRNSFFYEQRMLEAGYTLRELVEAGFGADWKKAI